nr:MFS transporter [Streptomyces oceani]
MTRRQIMEALSGLLLGMFVAILSSTIVSAALPKIINDLGGGQSAYTWVVTASLLTMTASTPLWGKLADLTSKKLLVQLSLVIFVLASAGAGLAQSSGMLIGFRAIQGLGMGGLTALAQIILAAMIAPRERGRYNGLLGAVFAVATVGGPLLGGVITDAEALGWRWCFYVAVPFAVVALIVLQKTLHLPVVKRAGVKIDWLGALVFTASVSVLLIWVSLAGKNYDWLSVQTYVMVPAALVLGLLFVLVESRAKEPIVPLRLFRNRTITLASLASLFVGVAMFGATVFLIQYFQLARGKSPTVSGLMTIPMIGGLFLSSTVSGWIITRTGRWKSWLSAGGVLLTAGLGLLGTMAYDTPYWRVAVFMALLGLGIGMMMQNLVLCTQNQVDMRDLGTASSVVAFFRSLGGAIGVSALGAILAERITHYTREGFAELGRQPQQGSGGTSGIPDLSKLPGPVRGVIESAYGDGIADIYLYATPLALVGLLLVLFIKEVPLKTRSAMEDDPTKPSMVEAEYGSPGGWPDASAGPAEQPNRETSRLDVGQATEAPADATSQLATVGAAPNGAGPNGATPREAPSWAPLPDAAGAPAAQKAQTARAEQSPAATAVSAAAASIDPSAGTGLHGTVRDPGGAALDHATVTLISLDGRQLGRCLAHADGSYVLDAPGPGSYVLIAAADGHQPQASTAAVGDGYVHHDILLTGSSGIVGTVLGAVDAKPVAEAMVVVTDIRGEVLATKKTGEDGEFGFSDLVAGTYTFAVNAPGYRPHARPIEIGEHGTTQLEVALQPGARVSGTIRGGADQHPLPDARVTLIDAAGNVTATATTDEDGCYAFTDLAAGQYSVIASGYPPVASALTVQGHGVDGYDVELSHPEE